MAKEKRLRNECFKEKSKSLKMISKECTSILRDYQEQMGEDKEKNQRNIRKAAVVVCLFKFGLIIQDRSEVIIVFIKETRPGNEEGDNNVKKNETMFKKIPFNSERTT